MKLANVREKAEMGDSDSPKAGRETGGASRYVYIFFVNG